MNDVDCRGVVFIIMDCVKIINYMTKGDVFMKINQVSGHESYQSHDYSVKKSPEIDTAASVEDVKTENVVNTESSTVDSGANGEGGKVSSIDEEILKKSVEQANKTLASFDKYIEREVHEVTHAIIYRLKDSRTNQVIQEFPPKKIQDMIAKMWEMAGLFIDKKL